MSIYQGDKLIAVDRQDVEEILSRVKGTDGANGADGISPHIGVNGNWWIGSADTGVKAGGKDAPLIRMLKVRSMTEAQYKEVYLRFQLPAGTLQAGDVFEAVIDFDKTTFGQQATAAAYGPVYYHLFGGGWNGRLEGYVGTPNKLTWDGPVKLTVPLNNEANGQNGVMLRVCLNGIQSMIHCPFYIYNVKITRPGTQETVYKLDLSTQAGYNTVNSRGRKEAGVIVQPISSWADNWIGFGGYTLGSYLTGGIVLRRESGSFDIPVTDKNAFQFFTQEDREYVSGDCNIINNAPDKHGTAKSWIELEPNKSFNLNTHVKAGDAVSFLCNYGVKTPFALSLAKGAFPEKIPGTEIQGIALPGDITNFGTVLPSDISEVTPNASNPLTFIGDMIAWMANPDMTATEYRVMVLIPEFWQISQAGSPLNGWREGTPQLMFWNKAGRAVRITDIVINRTAVDYFRMLEGVKEIQ